MVSLIILVTKTKANQKIFGELLYSPQNSSKLKASGITTLRKHKISDWSKLIPTVDEFDFNKILVEALVFYA